MALFEVLNKFSAPRSANKITLAEAMERFIADRKLRNFGYEWHMYQFRTLDRFLQLRGLSDAIDPNTITKQLLDDFVRYLLHEKPHRNTGGRLKSGTVNRVISSFKVFFKFLAEEGIINENPAEHLHKIREPKMQLQIFKTEQVEELVSAIKPYTFAGRRDRLAIQLLLDTGIRRAELLRLRVSDIDFQERLIRVWGKGSKERLAPFGERTAEFLKTWILENGLSDEQYIFVHRFEHQRPIHPNTFGANIRRYGQRAGITGVRVSPHTFRHTFGTRWIANGGDPFSLQRILGHTTLEMTQLYVDLNTEDLQRKHKVFGLPDNQLGQVDFEGQDYKALKRRPKPRRRSRNKK